jgi:isopenicillin N synthase-like dioxygenase
VSAEDTPATDTPETPETPEPRTETPPPADNPAPDNGLSEVLAGLQAQVASLTETVGNLIANGLPTPDDAPAARPWTHWGSK